MKVVCVVGPYRSKTEFGVHENIRTAELVALEVWRLGAVCICPQKNTAYFGGALPDSVWLDGALELVRRSDAVYLLVGWRDSVGACAEKGLAEELGKPVFRSLTALHKWLAGVGG